MSAEPIAAEAEDGQSWQDWGRDMVGGAVARVAANDTVQRVAATETFQRASATAVTASEKVSSAVTATKERITSSNAAEQAIAHANYMGGRVGVGDVNAAAGVESCRSWHRPVPAHL